jgi:hypothetical protein
MSLLDALQTVLEAEHAAFYVYGVLGARTSASAQPQLFAEVSDGYAAHRARRDQLRSSVYDAGGTPAAAQPAYDLPNPASTPAQVTRAALAIERASATTYAWLVANSVGARRRWAVDALTNTAVRELTFWPGLGAGVGVPSSRLWGPAERCYI